MVAKRRLDSGCDVIDVVLGVCVLFLEKTSPRHPRSGLRMTTSLCYCRTTPSLYDRVSNRRFLRAKAGDRERRSKGAIVCGLVFDTVSRSINCHPKG